MLTKIETARGKYKPNKIKCLLIAESPPDITSERFFYYEQYFSHGDTLYMETMKSLFPDNALTGGDYKRKKSKYLNQFMNAGLYLEDASSIPFPKDSSKSYKKKMLRSELPNLKAKLKELIQPSTPIILIADTVFEICYAPLREEGYNVQNNKVIYFPISFQPEYRAALQLHIQQLGINFNPELY